MENVTVWMLVAALVLQAGDLEALGALVPNPSPSHIQVPHILLHLPYIQHASPTQEVPEP